MIDIGQKSSKIKHTTRHLFCFLITCLVLPIVVHNNSYAQPAVIPFKRNTILFQPGEQAIVAFNGKKETIIVRQYLKSSRYTEALRVFPFQSEVKFGIADASVFSKVKNLAKAKKLAYKTKYTEIAGGKKQNRYQFFVSDRYLGRPVGMRVVKVVKPRNLYKIINSKVRKQKPENSFQFLTAKQKTTFNYYLERRFNYFYLDEIKVRPKTRGIRPIYYSFNTDKLYYPLELGRFFFRSGEIRIFLLYSQNSVDPDCLSSAGNGWITTGSVTVSKDEVKRIDPGISSLFDTGKIKLRVLLYRGELDSLSVDLFCGAGKTP